MSHPVDSSCRQRSSTPDHVWAPMLVNRPKRMCGSFRNRLCLASGSAVAEGGECLEKGLAARRRALDLHPIVVEDRAPAHVSVLLHHRGRDARAARIELGPTPLGAAHDAGWDAVADLNKGQVLAAAIPDAGYVAVRQPPRGGV